MNDHYTSTRPSNNEDSLMGSVYGFARSLSNAVSTEVAQLREDLRTEVAMFTDEDRAFFYGDEEEDEADFTTDPEFLYAERRKRQASEMEADSSDDEESPIGQSVSVPEDGRHTKKQRRARESEPRKQRGKGLFKGLRKRLKVRFSKKKVGSCS